VPLPPPAHTRPVSSDTTERSRTPPCSLRMGVRSLKAALACSFPLQQMLRRACRTPPLQRARGTRSLAMAPTTHTPFARRPPNSRSTFTSTTTAGYVLGCSSRLSARACLTHSLAHSPQTLAGGLRLLEAGVRTARVHRHVLFGRPRCVLQHRSHLADCPRYAAEPYACLGLLVVSVGANRTRAAQAESIRSCYLLTLPTLPTISWRSL
jgi:hypothetical protein